MEKLNEESIIRKELMFYGSVQGVGFRYRAQYAASACGVTGWVKNEWDGSVCMEAQGTQQQIQEMLRMIRGGTYIQIDEIKEEIISVEKNERGFHVR